MARELALLWPIVATFFGSTDAPKVMKNAAFASLIFVVCATAENVRQLGPVIGRQKLDSVAKTLTARERQDAAARAKQDEQLRRQAADIEERTQREERYKAEARERAAIKEAEWMRLANQWRKIGDFTTNLTWSGWRHLSGKVLETQAEGLRVWIDKDETILLVNYGAAVADGEPVNAYAAHTGLHRYITTQGGRATIRKYDLGSRVDAPWWFASEMKALEASKVRAREREAEEAASREAQRRAATQARDAETLARVINYQMKQASNGSPSFQLELGKRFLKGDGVATNRELALHWLQSAATNRESQAIKILSEISR